MLGCFVEQSDRTFAQIGFQTILMKSIYRSNIANIALLVIYHSFYTEMFDQLKGLFVQHRVNSWPKGFDLDPPKRLDIKPTNGLNISTDRLDFTTKRLNFP